MIGNRRKGEALLGSGRLFLQSANCYSVSKGTCPMRTQPGAEQEASRLSLRKGQSEKPKGTSVLSTNYLDAKPV